MTFFGSAAGDVTKGLCESPVVMDGKTEDDEGGDILGFFKYSKGDTGRETVRLAFLIETD